MTKPNIIFILCDDLGYRDLGCYGGKVIPTPCLDQLATESMRFTQCYTGSPICAPSRCVLMTGQHSGHCRVRDNFAKTGGIGEQRRVPLEADDYTVAELLKAAGYTTGITGKWGLAEPETDGVPTRRGFDEWFGYLNQRNAHTYYPLFLWRNTTMQYLEGNRYGDREPEYSHDMIFDFALDFVRENRDGPFFLYLPWTLPHGRYEIPSVEPFEDEFWTEKEKVFAAMVHRIDRQVGELMALLRELSIDDNTYVFFGSDHGSGERWDGVFDSCGELRGKKGLVYEGGIRTPMIVHGPGVPAGKVSEQPWYYADFLSTCAEVTGSDVPAGVDGASILRTLKGETQDELADRFLYWEFFAGGFQQAVRWRDWKAVRPKTKRGFEEPLELYNLAEDIEESKDVADQQPDVMEQVNEFLARCRTDSPYWPVT